LSELKKAIRVNEIRASSGWLEFSNGGESVPHNDDERFDADAIIITRALMGLIDDLIEEIGGLTA
jgi:DNA recombination-dependent growth factor C